MAAEMQSADIPVWFNGTQRWMTGVTKRTTCDDVIYALLVSTCLHETESTDTFAIFEKWREVERPLSARTKILKVWSFWGEEQPNVQLSMRSLDDYFLPGESSLYTRSRRRHKKSSRHKERHSTQCRHHNKPEYTECSRFRTLEQLVKLVVSQERKIQDLNDRIQETDTLIDKHEARIHLHRVQQNGTDYVQNSYLNSHSSGSSSSSADNTSLGAPDLRDLKAIFPESSLQQLEEIARICDNMGHLEGHVAQEQAKIQELSKEAGEMAESPGAVVQLEGEINAEFEDARVQMIRAVATYVTNEYNERELDRKIDICLAEITAKTEYIYEMQRKISDIEHRGSDAELSERRTNHGDNFSSQHLSSTATPPVQTVPSYTLMNSRYDTRYQASLYPNPSTPPVQAAHNYNLMNSRHDTRYQASLYHNPASEGNNQYPNRNRNLYNISGQFLRNLQLDQETLPYNSEAVHAGSSTGNAVIQDDKSSVLNQSSMDRDKYSDDTPTVAFNREGRSGRKSNRALQRPLFGRSRSAERSTDSIKLRKTSEYGKVNGGENSKLSGKSESYTTKALVDQYGLEMSTHLQGSNSRDFFRSTGEFPSNNPSHNLPTTACKPQNQRKETNQLMNSDSERRYQQPKEQTERKWHEDTNSIPTDISHSDSNNRSNQENHHKRSGSQIFSHDQGHLGTSVNNQQREGRTDTQVASVYTIGGREDRILGGGDSFFKDRSLFEENVSGVPRTGANSGGNGLHSGAIHIEVRNSPTSNWTFDVAKSERIDLSDCQNGYQNRLVANNVYVSSNCEHVKLQSGAGVSNMTQLSSPSKSVVIPRGMQTTQAIADRKIGNSQTERVDNYRQPTKENSQSSPIPCSKYQAGNQHIMHSDSSPRPQQISRLSDAYSSKPVSEDSIRTQSYQFTDTKWDDRNGVRSQHESVNNTNKHSTQQLLDTAAGPHQRLQFSTDATVVQSSTGVIRDNISSSHSVNPAVKSPQTPKMSPSLPSKNETVETNICSGGANRGALYHIVSNKMNKTKSGSVVYHYDNNMKGTGSEASATQHPMHKKPNTDLIHSVNTQPDVPHNKVNNQTTVNTPSLFSFHNGDYNNDPSTFYPSTVHQNHSYSGYNKDGYPIAPVVNNTKNKTRQTSDRPKGSSTIINHEMYDKAANNPTQNTYTSTSLGMNYTTIVQSSSSSIQNSANHTNGYHTGVYRTGRTNAVTIREIHENLSTVKGYPHSRGNRADGNARTNAVDVRERTKLEDVNDSNSDTGLSSMHSDETSNIETLV